MGSWLLPPTFAGNAGVPIPLGSTGQVLTMVDGIPRFANASSGGGGFFGGRIAYASPAGTVASVAPTGFPGSASAPVGLIVVTLLSGAATWTGLAAGVSNGSFLQPVCIYNGDASNTLELQPGGSAQQFAYVGTLALPPGASVIVLNDPTEGLWLIL